MWGRDIDRSVASVACACTLAWKQTLILGALTRNGICHLFVYQTSLQPAEPHQPECHFVAFVISSQLFGESDPWLWTSSVLLRAPFPYLGKRGDWRGPELETSPPPASLFFHQNPSKLGSGKIGSSDVRPCLKDQNVLEYLKWFLPPISLPEA